MAALSDYLESALLNHIFRNSTFPKPSNISIALTSDPPLDSDTGATLPELPSGVQKGSNFVTTNYRRLNLGAPAVSGSIIWSDVGVDDTTTFQVLGTSSSGDSVGISGYFYPLYLNENSASQQDSLGVTFEYRFVEFPGVLFFAPRDLVESGVSNNPSFTEYDGNGFIKNSTQFVFDTALEDWGWISGVAIVDNAGYKQGNILMYSKLSNPRYVYTGDNIKFDLNSLEISLQ
jgi:hypothetical protein